MELIRIYTIINPMIVFWGIWGVVCVLLELKLSLWLVDLEGSFLCFLFIAFMSNFIGYLCGSLFCIKKIKKQILEIDYEKLWKITRKILYVWFVFNCLQIIYSEGIPFLWLITGNEKTYFDFGIHGLNGCLMAIYYVICLNLYLILRKSRNIKYKILFMLLMIWPVLLVTRQVIMVLAIELFFLSLSFKHINIKLLLKYICAFWGGVLLFGIMGDFRTGAEHFWDLAMPSSDWIYMLPPGVFWGYIYMTTPIANLQNIFLYIPPLNQLYYSISTLVPSFIRLIMFDDVSGWNVGDGLITSTFNVSTFMADFYMDYGVLYVYIIMFFIGCISKVIYHHVKYNTSYASMLIYCVFMQMLILSIFDDMFLYLPIIFQVVVIYYVKRRL